MAVEIILDRSDSRSDWYVQYEYTGDPCRVSGRVYLGKWINATDRVKDDSLRRDSPLPEGVEPLVATFHIAVQQKFLRGVAERKERTLKEEIAAKIVEANEISSERLNTFLKSDAIQRRVREGAGNRARVEVEKVLLDVLAQRTYRVSFEASLGRLSTSSDPYAWIGIRKSDAGGGLEFYEMSVSPANWNTVNSLCAEDKKRVEEEAYSLMGVYLWPNGEDKEMAYFRIGLGVVHDFVSFSRETGRKAEGKMVGIMDFMEGFIRPTGTASGVGPLIDATLDAKLGPSYGDSKPSESDYPFFDGWMGA